MLSNIKFTILFCAVYKTSSGIGWLTGIYLYCNLCLNFFYVYQFTI